MWLHHFQLHSDLLYQYFSKEIPQMKRNLYWKQLCIISVSLLFIATVCAYGGGNNSGKETCNNQDSTSSQSRTWFSIKKIADNVWRIDDHGGDNMYLVVGDDKALVIDAGTGVADVAACVRSITCLPVMVVNTHGHPDHCGSDYQFKEVYAHQSDFNMIQSFCNENFHKGALKRAEEASPELSSLFAHDTSNFKMPELLPIQQGFMFDLGNRNLEVIEVPGHTQGSVCLLDAKNKLLFTGDNNNSLVWLFLKDCLPLEIYLQTLQALQQRSSEYTILLPGHGDPLDKEFIGKQII
jgi:glyoxylase-like metal-dependent hydrolase (beta-lactamase superfamily II)